MRSKEASENLSVEDWVELLREQPELADRCEKWSSFSSFNWRRLLTKRPQFANRCDKWKDIDAYDLREILIAHPQFAYLCDWEKFYEGELERPGYRWFGGQWADVLIARPQFADKCDWNRLHAHTWAKILSVHPQFFTGCPWEKFDGYDWSTLLSSQPQFACQCDWEKLNAGAWYSLLKEQPQFEDKCTKWDEFGVYDWSQLLEAQPQFIKYKEEVDRKLLVRAAEEKKLKKSSKSRKPARITWEKFQESVVGLDSSEAAVIMNMSFGDEDKEVSYDIDLKGPHGTVVISGTFTVDDDGKIVSIDEPDIEGDLYDDDDYERVYARLLRRFQGEQVFVPKDSPSVFF